jgi:putative RecB family exonuclease
MPLDPPRTLSPSKVSSFTDCPLAFRFSIIDRLPEPPSAPAVKGTLVHAALESLFWRHPAGSRSWDAARAELASAWSLLQTDPEFTALELTTDRAEEFLADAELLVRNYFELEDPDGVRAVGVELGLETHLGGMRLRGIIDRLDLDDHGDLVVVDYKTGRAPSVRFEHSRLSGVHIYSLLCERVLGRVPVAVRLLHLRDPLAITAVPTDQSVRGQRQRTTAVWAAIERACARDDFRPRPGPLCNYCNFQALCPAVGGSLPVVAEAS